MANATAPVFSSRSRVVPYAFYTDYPVAAAQNFYAGQMVGLNAGGLLVSTGYVKVIGRAAKTLLGASVNTLLRVEHGIFYYTNAGTNTITAATRGLRIYADDNQTVSTLNTNPQAGYCYDLDAGGVWVLLMPAFG